MTEIILEVLGYVFVWVLVFAAWMFVQYKLDKKLIDWLCKELENTTNQYINLKLQVLKKKSEPVEQPKWPKLPKSEKCKMAILKMHSYWLSTDKIWDVCHLSWSTVRKALSRWWVKSCVKS